MKNITKTTKKATTTTNTTTSIIEVQINGLTKEEALSDIKTRLASVEKSVFNIALDCVYALGYAIPEHIDCQGNHHAQAICEKPYRKQSQLLDEVGRSKSTLSRWIKAMTLIIDNGHFLDFASGTFPFSYDKIIIIFENEEVFGGRDLKSLMAYTVKDLENDVKNGGENSEENTEETTAGEENSTEETTEENTEVDNTTTVFIYDDKQYEVNKAIFEEWILKNAKLV